MVVQKTNDDINSHIIFSCPISPTLKSMNGLQWWIAYVVEYSYFSLVLERNSDWMNNTCRSVWVGWWRERGYVVGCVLDIVCRFVKDGSQNCLFFSVSNVVSSLSGGFLQSVLNLFGWWIKLKMTKLPLFEIRT